METAVLKKINICLSYRGLVALSPSISVLNGSARAHEIVIAPSAKQTVGLRVAMLDNSEEEKGINVEVERGEHEQHVDDDRRMSGMLIIFTTSAGKDLINRMLKLVTGVSYVVVYSNNVISTYGIELIDKYTDSGRRMDRMVSVLTAVDIAFEKPLSRLVSRYRVLTDKEAEDHLAKKKITLKQLPVMLRADPLATYLGFSPGTIVYAIDADVHRLVV